MNLAPNPWTRVAAEEVTSNRIFSVRSESWHVAHTGQTHQFAVLSAPDWVNVVAVTNSGEIVLVAQYRVGVAERTVEIPGGMIDPGESPLDAARRELLEETGYSSEEWEQIGRVRPNPAFQTNWCYTFLARNAQRVADPTPEGTEDIEVIVESRESLHTRIAEGTIDHALVVAAAYWAGRS